MLEMHMNTARYFPPERRRHPRTRLHLMLHGINLDPEAGEVRDTLEMLDISRGGMGAIADRWMYPGQKIILCLPLHPEGGRRNVYATVIRCGRQQGGYRVGLQFDHAAVSAVQGLGLARAAAAA
jgi:hypothetical protein